MPKVKKIQRSFELPTADGGSEIWDDLFMVAEIAGVSYDTVRDWVNTKQLAAKKVGRRRVVRRSDLGVFLASLAA